MSALDELKFAPLPIAEVFEEIYATRAWYDKIRLNLDGEAEFLFVSRTRGNNGVDDHVPSQNLAPERGDCLTIALDTQVVAYQPTPFYTSQNIQILRHREINPATGVALVAIVSTQMGKFSWGGNGVTLGRLRRLHVMVPVTPTTDGTPTVDWDGLARLGAELLSKAITHTHRIGITGDDDSIPLLKYAPMEIYKIFETARQTPAWLNMNQVEKGEPAYPQVSNSAASNSINQIIAEQAVPPNPGNAITIGIDTQVVAYQPVPFYGSTKVFELRAENLNSDNAPLLIAALMNAIQKYSWGHKASGKRLSRTKIVIPVTTNENNNQTVDWDGMTKYGRALKTRAEPHRDTALMNIIPAASLTQLDITTGEHFA